MLSDNSQKPTGPILGPKESDVQLFKRKSVVLKGEQYRAKLKHALEPSSISNL